MTERGGLRGARWDKTMMTYIDRLLRDSDDEAWEPLDFTNEEVGELATDSTLHVSDGSLFVQRGHDYECIEEEIVKELRF